MHNDVTYSFTERMLKTDWKQTESPCLVMLFEDSAQGDSWFDTQHTHKHCSVLICICSYRYLAAGYKISHKNKKPQRLIRNSDLKMVFELTGLWIWITQYSCWIFLLFFFQMVKIYSTDVVDVFKRQTVVSQDGKSPTVWFYYYPTPFSAKQQQMLQSISWCEYLRNPPATTMKKAAQPTSRTTSAWFHFPFCFL